MYRLTKPQKLIYDMEKYSGGAIAVVCGRVLWTGRRDLAELQRAANALYRINDALRTRIVETDEGTRQDVFGYAEREIEVRTFSCREELDAFGEAYAKQPLDLYGSLCEMKIVELPGQYGVLIRMHHLIGDAWSLSVLAAQFRAVLEGETPTAGSYEEYAKAEAAYLESGRYEKDRAYFLEQFKACDEATFLSEKQAASFSARRKSFLLDAGQTQRILSYAQAHHTSPFVLFMTALAVYVSRVTMNTKRFYIGTAVLNRTGVREKNTVGMFINTVPLLMDLDYDKSFSENLASVEETAFAAFRHQKFHYGDALAAIRHEYGYTEKLYDVVLSYQNARIAENGEAESVWYHSGSQTESLQIHIADRDGKGLLDIHYDYQTDRFRETEIERLHQRLCRLLFDALAHDDRTIGELELLTDDERQKVLYGFNDTAVEYPREKTVRRLFEEQVARVPERTAVIAHDRTLTYKELDGQASRIAHGLMEKGVGRGDIVAFVLSRKSCLIAAMFGILKAGAAYLPIDPAYPPERIRYMMTDSGARYCISDETVGKLLACEETVIPDLSDGDDIAYCLFTSGTTGAPKAALVRHRNVSNFVACNRINDRYQTAMVPRCSVVLAATSVVFDVSVFEVLFSLLNGMTVVLADEEDILSADRLAQLISRHGVEVLHGTPTKIAVYLESEAFRSAAGNLKMLMIGGEVFPPELLKKIARYSDAAVYNGYGPTETTVGVAFCRLNAPVDAHAEDDEEAVTIGKPIANTQIYIVDRYRQPVPVGVTGELCIAGEGVGAGYLHRPALTAEKFIDNPFGKGKLYLTGDLARWREDGRIAYVGRNDYQVKVRGLRIELGEIENAISAVDGVSQAVVTVRKNEAGRQLICAFYTGATLSGKDIRAAIGQKLPSYMLPHSITHLEKMPLTAGGKISRRALPEVDLNRMERFEEYSRPEGGLEKRLAALMEEVLEAAPIGRNDDFFEHGGDSLQAIEFISKARSEGIVIALQNLFDHPTVQGLAECLAKGDKQPAVCPDEDTAGIRAILAENTGDTPYRPSETPVGNLLLTGATGYLGIHILADFLEHDGGVAYCLVRGSAPADCEERLAGRLRFYFGSRYTKNDRIRVIRADLTQDRFGLTGAEYETLAKNVDTVINAAASVKHYGSYRYFHETNVESVERLIAFCRTSGARLIHISTLSVSGNTLGDVFDGRVSETEKQFREYNLSIGQPLDNVYVRSKYEAEMIVLEAVRDGLCAAIMRMGNLTNRLSDGVFQINHETNAFLKRFQAVLEMGVFPDYLMDLYAEFTPVDEAAGAVMTIVRHADAGRTVFHISSPHVVGFEKLLEYLDELGYGVRVTDGNAFTEALRKTAKESGREHIFETFINDMDAHDRLQYDSRIHIENDITVRCLRQLGFEWSDIGLDYLRQYMAYFEKIGYWKRG